MELNPGQRRLLFAVVVVALAGLAFYLVSSRSSGGPPAAAASTPAGGGAKTAASAPTAAGVPPSSVPAATPVSTAGGAEIYQWLPFSATDLAAAAQTTVTFARDYATWSYTENAAAYTAKMSGLVTATEATTLENGYGTAGVAGPRTADKQVSAGSGTIDAISSFGSSPSPSITFLVTISQQVSSTQPAKSLNAQYTVTVVSSGTAWQVNDIELSGLGNT
jgi:hypothetical protein